MGELLVVATLLCLVVVLVALCTAAWHCLAEVLGLRRPAVERRATLPPARPNAPPIRVRPHLQTTLSDVAGNGRLRVEADGRPLWMIRGWRRQGNRLIGAFRTPLGSCAGVIELSRSGHAESYYIVNPPARLLNGSHGPCFRPRGAGSFWVHFLQADPNPDSGIVAVETLLRKALGA